jgi:Fe-S-cluster-containing hydrogenase component 2
MVRVFMLIPGIEIPHLCTQCTDYPCVDACPYDALSVNNLTGAVIVDQKKCTACGVCSAKCPGKIPHLHPNRKYVLICDLCYGDPQCAKICEEAGYNALRVVEKTDHTTYDSYAKTPEELTKDLAPRLYGEQAKELM